MKKKFLVDGHDGPKLVKAESPRNAIEKYNYNIMHDYSIATTGKFPDLTEELAQTKIIQEIEIIE